MPEFEDRSSSIPDPNEFEVTEAAIEPKLEFRAAFSETLAQHGFPDTLVLARDRAEDIFSDRRLEIVDYLLKPVSFERFFKAANRALDMLSIPAARTGTLINIQEEHIFIKVDKLLKKVFVQDILFVQSMGNYVVVQTTRSREVTYCTLQQMMSSLPGHRFIACHRSYLVNKSRIAIIEGNQLHIGDYKIPIARNLRDEVLASILNRG